MDKHNYISILLITAITIYLFGYDISHYVYNYHEETKGTLEFKNTVKSFWQLRFSLYSVIIMILLYVSRLNLTRFNVFLCRVGFNLALISVIDKMLLKEYSFSEYDSYIIVGVILIEFINFKLKK